ncbi:hypothetical protein ACFLT9_07910 [Acidobacteriota bacterium]
MKNKWVTIGLMVCLFPLILQGVPSKQEADRSVRIKANSVKVRAMPNYVAEVIKVVSKDQVLPCVALENGWYQVVIKNKEGASVNGYIHQALAEEVSLNLKEKGITEEEKPKAPKKVDPLPVRTPVSIKSPPTRSESEVSAVAAQQRFYIGAAIGAGVGFSKFWAGRKSDGSDIYIHPGGGIDFHAIFGMKLSVQLRLELTAHYQANGSVASNGSVSFKRYPLAVQILYIMPSSKNWKFYLGAGPVMSIGPSYKEKIDSSMYYVDYNSPFGAVARIGFTTEGSGKRSFMFAEAAYMGPFSYSFNDASFSPPSVLRSLNGNGIYFNFGYVFFLGGR